MIHFFIETPTGDGVKRMVDVLGITSPSYIPTSTSDTSTSTSTLIDQTITLVDREENRTREDMIQSLQQRKQKMTRNPKRHEYMNRAAYQLAVSGVDVDDVDVDNEGVC